MKACAVCSYPARASVDEQLHSGGSPRALAKLYPGLTRLHLTRHRDGCEGTGDRHADLPGLRFVEDLGGSTGAALMEDDDGGLFAVKRGADPGHVLEESYADEVYRVLGVPVPDGGLRREGGRAWKVSAFVEGRGLRDMLLGGDEKTARRVALDLCEGFAADALLANWDVIGVAFGNPLLGADGTVYRVDNGSALRRRARGQMKPPGTFTGEVRELRMLRDSRVNPSAAWTFSDLSDEEIARQVRETIVPNERAVLGVLPGELKGVVGARIEHMAAWSAGILGGET